MSFCIEYAPFEFIKHQDFESFKKWLIEHEKDDNFWEALLFFRNEFDQNIIEALISCDYRFLECLLPKLEKHIDLPSFLNKAGRLGYTPLQQAVQGFHPRIAYLMVQYGADYRIKLPMGDGDCRNIQGASIFREFIEEVELILPREANLTSLPLRIKDRAFTFSWLKLSLIKPGYEHYFKEAFLSLTENAFNYQDRHGHKILYYAILAQKPLEIILSFFKKTEIDLKTIKEINEAVQAVCASKGMDALTASFIKKLSRNLERNPGYLKNEALFEQLVQLTEFQLKLETSMEENDLKSLGELVGHIKFVPEKTGLKIDPLEMPLALAFKNQSVEQCELLIKQGVKFQDLKHIDFLFEEFLKGKNPRKEFLEFIECQKNYIFHQEQFSLKEIQQYTQLICAIKNNACLEDCLFYLFDLECRLINIEDYTGNFLIQYAVLRNDIKLCEELFQLNARLDVLDFELNTLAHFAVKRASVEMLYFLKFYGCNFQLRNKAGLTPCELFMKSRESVSESKETIEQMTVFFRRLETAQISSLSKKHKHIEDNPNLPFVIKLSDLIPFSKKMGGNKRGAIYLDEFMNEWLVKDLGQTGSLEEAFIGACYRQLLGVGHSAETAVIIDDSDVGGRPRYLSGSKIVHGLRSFYESSKKMTYSIGSDGIQWRVNGHVVTGFEEMLLASNLLGERDLQDSNHGFIQGRAFRFDFDDHDFSLSCEQFKEMLSDMNRLFKNVLASSNTRSLSFLNLKKIYKAIERFSFVHLEAIHSQSFESFLIESSDSSSDHSLVVIQIKKRIAEYQKVMKEFLKELTEQRGNSVYNSSLMINWKRFQLEASNLFQSTEKTFPYYLEHLKSKQEGWSPAYRIKESEHIMTFSQRLMALDKEYLAGYKKTVEKNLLEVASLRPVTGVVMGYLFNQVESFDYGFDFLTLPHSKEKPHKG